MKRWLVYLILLVQSFCMAYASAEISIPPQPTGSNIYVQDYANVISPEDELRIKKLGRELEQKTTAQIAVLTIKSLEGQALEDYSLEVLRQWGIGQKDKNNGVLLLVVTNDRQSRIEVGYGLEGALPDGLTGTLQDRYMLPYFRNGDYSKGIFQGYGATAIVVARDAGVTLQGIKGEVNTTPLERPAPSKPMNPLTKILIFLGFVVLIAVDYLFFGGFFTNLLLLLFLRGGRGGGGGGSFGGGSGGGGGSSRNW